MVILLAYLFHYSCYPFFFLVGVRVLLNLAEHLSVGLHLQLIKNKLWKLPLQYKFVAIIEVKFALTLLVLSVVSDPQKVLIHCLKLLLLEFIVSLFLSQVLPSASEVVIG